MPDDIGKRVLTPDTGYVIEMIIKDKDYTNDLKSVRIVSSITGIYPIVTFSMSLDPNDLILENVMDGKEYFKMSVKLIGRKADSFPLEEVSFELQVVKHSSYAQSKPKMTEGTYADRTLVSVITVCRKPFKTMTTMVNDVFIGKTPKQIITELVSKTEAKLIYDSEGENSTSIEQVILPPATLINAIYLLKNDFGLFDGASAIFCSHDNVLHIINLSGGMKKSQLFTVNHLALDDSKNTKIVENSSDGKTFYTYGALQNQYCGNSKFASIARKVNYVVKPKDEFYKVITKNLDDVCKNYGVIATNSNGQSPQISLDSNLTDRETYSITHSGNDSSELFINNKLAGDVSNFSTIQLALEKSLYILDLMNVGSVVKLKTGTMEYKNLAGKYVLKSSDINFSRGAADWASICSLTLSRTNQFF